MTAGWERAASVGFTLVLGLAACTGGSDGTAATESTSTSELTLEQAVRVGIGGPLLVDPVKASLASPGDLMVLDLLHDGLTRVDADGVAEPALAASWQPNSDFTAFEFQLAPEATFTGGRPVTAEDVIASLERVIAGGDSSLAALSLETVTGYEAFVAGEADQLSGLSAPDAHTIAISLDTPLSVLPEVLSNPVFGVVDGNTLAADDLGSSELTGAWEVASADDAVVRLEPREAGSGSLEAIELRLYDDDGSAYAAFEEGEVDWAEVPDVSYEQAVATYGADAFAPFHAELFFGMNVSSPNLAEVGLREAIAAAVDREAIVEAVYPDRADPLSALVPTGVTPDGPVACDSCGYDRAAAAAKVEEAFPDGDVPTVRIDFDESDPQKAMADIVASNLEDVGIPTELRPKPRSDYESFIVSGEQELFSFGWIGVYGSPDAYLAPLFGSAADDNLTGFRSDSVDLWLNGARRVGDRSTQTELWGLAEHEILESAVVVPIAQFRTQVVVADRVEGLTHAVDGTVDWSQVRVTA
jgi:ABC-type transport system substrate-binding protein